MTSTAPTVDVEGLLEQLDVVVDRISRTDTHLSALMNRRRELFRALLAAGVPQAQLARRAKVTPMAVSLAVNPKPKKPTTGPPPAV